jgi:predicted HicB family RNase H-like nuclease
MAVTMKIPITKSQDGIPNTPDRVIRKRVRLPPDLKIAEKKAKKEAQAAKKASNASRKSLRLELDPDLFQLLKENAKAKKVTVNSIVTGLIKEYIDS